MNSDELVYIIKYGNPDIRLLENTPYKNTCTVCGLFIDFGEPRYLVGIDNLHWVVCPYCYEFVKTSIGTKDSLSIASIQIKRDMKRAMDDFKKRFGL
jgi:hypothetical protein